MYKKYVIQHPFTWLIFAIVLYLSFMTIPDFPELEDVPFIDKWTHIVMYFCLSGAVWLDYLRRYGLRFSPWPHGVRLGEVSRLRLFVGACLLPIAAGGVIEVLQENFTNHLRSGDWYDFLADALGAFLTYLFGLLFLMRQR